MADADRLTGDALDRRVTLAAAAIVAAMPLLLIHARGVAEGLFAVLGALFVIRCARARDWSAFRQPWVVAGLLYWAWLLLVTLLMHRETEQIVGALAWGRMPLALLALSAWILADAEARRWLFYGSGLAILWTALEVWLQLLFGRGILGFRRWPAGELPGPFTRPRAGHWLGFGMWPLLLGVAAPLILRRDALRRIAGWALLAFACATIIFVGQRMPMVFTVFGLLIAALLIPQLRLPAIAAIGAGAAALAVSSVVAPAAFHRLVVQFSRQLANFGETHYGQILARGLEMAHQHPLTGLGEAGFQTNCPDPAYHVGWMAGSDGGGAGICVTHAHNHYLQALTDGGWPGLLLFIAFAVLLVLAAARGLLRAPSPLRVGVFIAAFLPLWPLTSGNAFTNMPMAGLWLLMAGWALAEARAAERPQS
ncbi:O-antigen ligase family protein [Falsiroseomonas oryzae]|uniref:O-antigen ligase family protein n=1 Tax=Falsiroseomonas oryzae TaxID=2766473 RepID=UPI0022EBA221|nr:O-antigen ligase family protein [Roseomonas sp. MO-31]